MSALTQTFGSILRLSRAIVQGDNKVQIGADVEYYHRQDGYRAIEMVSSDAGRIKEIKARLAAHLPRICKKNARVSLHGGKTCISISIWRDNEPSLRIEWR